MNLAFILASCSASIALALGLISWRMSRAPGWVELRWFALVMAGAGIYAGGNIVSIVHFSDPAVVVASQIQLAGLLLEVLGWFELGDLVVGRVAGPRERVVRRLIPVLCVISLLPGTVYGTEVTHHRFAPWGVTYSEAVPTTLGAIFFVVGVGSPLVVLVRLIRSWRSGNAPAGAYVVALGTLVVFGVNDALAALSVTSAPYLLDAGIVGPLVLLVWGQTRRFVADAEALVDLRRNLEHKVEERTSALATAEGNFRRLVEGSPDLILIHRAGIALYANPAMLRMLGLGADELRGKAIVSWVHPEDRARTGERLLSSGLLSPQTLRMRDVSGRERAAEFVALDLDYQGAPARVAIGRDVTERNAALARLTLSDRLASVGTLAAGVAHELNNPLAFVKSNLEFVVDELCERAEAPGPPGRAPLDEVLAALEESRAGVDRMGTIVRDLRALTREDGPLPIPVDPGRALARAGHLIGPLLRGRARLVSNVEPGLAISGSEARVAQVLVNLLVNAAQAIEPGDPERHSIEVSARMEGARVMLEVSDTGAGMTEEVRRRAFEPFFTTKGPGEGAGLGLWICHSIVTAMGGEIHAEPGPARGSVFRVLLPAVGATAGAPTQ